MLCVLLLFVSFAPAKTRHAKKSSSKPAVTTAKHSSAHSAKSKSYHASSGKHSKKGGKTSAKAVRRGQQGISPERAREIQEALIRENYLDGEPSGVWDQQTKAALVKLQTDNRWQTKVIPDSRALIKLGLGPDHTGLLNPESAVVGTPRTLGAERTIPGGATPQ